MEVRFGGRVTQKWRECVRRLHGVSHLKRQMTARLQVGPEKSQLPPAFPLDPNSSSQTTGAVNFPSLPLTKEAFCWKHMLQSCCNYVDAYSITEESEALRCFRLNSSPLEGSWNLTLIHSKQNSWENSGGTKEATGGEQNSWPHACQGTRKELHWFCKLVVAERWFQMCGFNIFSR